MSDQASLSVSANSKTTVSSAQVEWIDRRTETASPLSVGAAIPTDRANHDSHALSESLANAPSLVGHSGSRLASFLGRISPSEWRRRLLHILPGFLPIILWFIRHHDPLSWDARAILAGVILAIGVGTAIKYKRIARQGETSNPACILGYTIPIFALLMFAPGQAELGLTVLAILSIGDGMATLGGLLLRGPRLPWNEEKSWAGFLCFIVFATPFAAVIYAGEAHPVVAFETAFTIAAIAVVTSAIFESIRSRIDDNIRVGVTAAIMLVAMQHLFVGWTT